MVYVATLYLWCIAIFKVFFKVLSVCVYARVRVLVHANAHGSTHVSLQLLELLLWISFLYPELVDMHMSIYNLHM